MQTFKVTRKAEADLLEISAYTQEKWGTAQRDKYLDDINERFHLLAKTPDYPTARDIHHINSGCFSLQINEHFIIYRKYNYGVRILRILSQTMDLKRHL